MGICPIVAPTQHSGNFRPARPHRVCALGHRRGAHNRHETPATSSSRVPERRRNGSSSHRESARAHCLFPRVAAQQAIARSSRSTIPYHRLSEFLDSRPICLHNGEFAVAFPETSSADLYSTCAFVKGVRRSLIPQTGGSSIPLRCALCDAKR